MTIAQPNRVAYPTIDALLGAMIERMRGRLGEPAMIESGGAWHHHLRRPKRSVTQGEIGRRITAAVLNLRSQGMREGDNVLYAVRPGVDAMVMLSALLLSGAKVIGLDPGISADTLAERLKWMPPRWVIAESIIFAATAPGPLRWWLHRRGMALPNIHLAQVRFVRVGSKLPGVPRSISFEAICGSPDATALPAPCRAEREVLAVFTSGTTSAPKVVLHTATSLGAACEIINRRMVLAPSDVVYSTQTHQMLAALMAGATCVVPPTEPDARRFIADVARFGVTHTYAVPFEMAAVVRLLEQRGRVLPAHLRMIILGSAPITPAFLARLRAVCAASTEVWCVYAMTEMFPVALVESREKLAFTGEGDLAGTPIEGARIEVADDGELSVGGPNLFSHYLGHNPAAMLATGDLARIDAQGHIVLLGRKKDMVIRGHHNIYPSLYEGAIGAIPGVEACALVGVPNEDGTDERLVLALEPRSGEDPQRLRKRVERALRDGSCPIDVVARPDFVIVCQLPYAGRTHKLDRRRLEQIVAAEVSRRGQ